MKKSTIAIALLIIALIATNAWWAYRMVDAGVSHTYQRDTLEETQQTLSQTLAIIKAISSHGASRANIIAAAQQVLPSMTPFEKDGYVWVGRVGLRFDKNNQLVEVVPGL